MRPRDVLVLTSALALFSAIGYVALAPESAAGEVAPDTPPPVTPGIESEPPAVAQVQGGAVGRGQGHPIEGDYSRKDTVVSTTGWTSGTIAGDIALVASVVSQIQSIQVTIEELKPATDGNGKFNERFAKTIRVERGIGTPTFRAEGIPFSSYGYTVTAHSPGLNGSRQTVGITEQHPLVDDVQLAISPGVPFSILLRDQDLHPHALVEVRMQPVGEPLGRPVRAGMADNNGSAIFEDVLSGDYLVHVGALAAPLADPVSITVHATARVYAGSVVQAQGQTITIPRGMPLPIQVTDIAGYGIPEALVQIQALDRKELKIWQLATDPLGRATFPNVPPGLWEISIAKDNFERRFKHLNVKDGATLATETFQLVRLRR